MKLLVLLCGFGALAYGQTLVSSANPSTFGQPVSFSLQTSSPNLFVTFHEGNSDVSNQPVIGTATANANGLAVFTTSSLSATTPSNPHPIFATFSLPSAGFTTNTVNQVVNKATPTVTLNAKPSTVNAGVGQITLTANLSPSDASGGTITFSDSTTGTTFTPAQLVGAGQAQLSINSPTQPGVHTLVATYSGDGNLNSSSGNTTLTVNGTTTTTISATPNPATFGQTVNISATVSPANATGQVQFSDGTNVLGQGTLSGGTASLPPLTTLAVGTHSLTASYLGDSTFPKSTSSPLSFVVNKAATTTTLTAGPNPANPGQTVALTAKVTGSTSNITGNVTFFDGSTQLSTVTLTSGSATFSSTGFTSGSHSLTATYNGDGNNLTSTSSAVNLAVNAPLSLAVSPNPATVGQTVTLTATVPVVNSAQIAVTFNDGGNPIGTATASGTTATFQTSSLSVGTHVLTATANNQTSNSVSEVINKANTTTNLTAAPTSPTQGQTVTLTATVSPSSATGAVFFTDNGTSIGSANLSNGTATMTTSSLAVGSHSLAATYGGDNNFNNSTSGAVPVAVGPGSSATTLAVTPNPAQTGQTVSLTATVTPSTATGAVTFQDNGAAIGTVNVNGGTAVFTTTSLTAGNHSLTAAYAGDARLSASTSAAVLEVVNPATSSSSTTLTVSPNPANVGATVTLNAAVTPATATGTIIFRDGTATIGQATLANGNASITTASLTVGSHSLTASYGGDASNGASTSAPSVEVINQATGTVTLTSSANPATVGQSITFTVTVSPLTATGSVTIFDSFTSSFLICVVNTDCVLNNGVANLTTTALGAGTHSLQAFYGGDNNNAASQSNILRQVVNPATAPTTTTLAVSPTSSTSGQAVTLTATVAPTSAATSAVPNGTVTFLDGTATLGTGTVSSGKATFTTSSLSSGTHTLTASYAGDSNFAPSTSNAVTETVAAGTAPTSTSLVVSPNTSNAGQAVTLTANVTPATATGTVTFKDGSTTLGTASLNNGNATITVTSLTPGTHSLTATYGGDSKNAPSTSSAVTETVTQPSNNTTRTVLTVSPNPASFGQTVTFTATVTPNTGTAAPTGTVTFLDGQTRLGTGNLTGGTATFTTTSLPAGNHSLTASYAGDSANGASISAAVTLVVSAPAPVQISAPACCTLPAAFVGAAYSQTFRATGGVNPLSWSLASNTTPDLSMASGTGILSGTPKTAGNFQVTIRVQDGAQQANAVVYNLAVVQPASVTWPPLTPTSPQDQPTSQLSLTQSYPFAVTGTVTLTFAPNAAGLPANYASPGMQFVSGGTTFQVTIPAGSTTPSPALPAIQLGSVAGTITATLGPLTMAGGTQTVPFAGQAPTTTIVVRPFAPIITAGSVKITTITASNFQVFLDALSNPRDLSSAVLTFTAANGAALTGCTPNCSVGLTSDATTWFASQTGRDNGGTFSLTLTFPFTGNASALNTVSVALVNSAGTSAAVTGGK